MYCYFYRGSGEHFIFTLILGGNMFAEGTMKITNLNNYSGQLLCFISKVAIAIRMNSSYNRSSTLNPETPNAVRELSDMLHNLNMIGDALSNGDPIDLVKKIEIQLGIWESSSSSIESASSLNCSGAFSLLEGISILEKMKNEVIQSIEC